MAATRILVSRPFARTGQKWNWSGSTDRQPISSPQRSWSKSMRIVFTGGSGKAGRHVVPWLKAKGYEILNLDLKPLDCEGVNTLTADVTDSGQVFDALSMHF